MGNIYLWLYNMENIPGYVCKFGSPRERDAVSEML